MHEAMITSFRTMNSSFSTTGDGGVTISNILASSPMSSAWNSHISSSQRGSTLESKGATELGSPRPRFHTTNHRASKTKNDATSRLPNGIADCPASDVLVLLADALTRVADEEAVSWAVIVTAGAVVVTTTISEEGIEASTPVETPEVDVLLVLVVVPVSITDPSLKGLNRLAR